MKHDVDRKCLSRGDNYCAQEAWLIIIDVDEATASHQVVHEALRQADIAHIIIGTHSYYAENKNRFRILLLSNTAYSKDQLEATSGQGGVTEDQTTGKVFSHHNDCLNDNFGHDSFDVMRLLKSLSL